MINPSTQLKGSSSPFRTIEKQILNNKSSILFKKKRKTFFKFNFKKTNRETKPFFSDIFNSLSSDLCWTCYLVLIFAFTWLMVLKTFGPYWVIVSLGRSLCILFQIFSSIFLFAQFDGPRHSVLSFMPVGSLSIGSLAVQLSEWFHQIQSFHFIIIKKKHKKNGVSVRRYSIKCGRSECTAVKSKSGRADWYILINILFGYHSCVQTI